LGSRSKELKTGYTTGACAAAAAKAAVLAMVGKEVSPNDMIEIPFPDRKRHSLPVASLNYGGFPGGASAAVIKNAGDDPDVTNGAEIMAKVVFHNGGTKEAYDPASSSYPKDQCARFPQIVISGGKGVGTVTKPGLSVPVGEAAINPVPRQMITDAVTEALHEGLPDGLLWPERIEVTIWVPEGGTIARKTLNHRLGIVGGISILGTTGIVRPLSAEAWTATISASMSVARAANLEEIVLSSGRSSEKAHMRKFQLPEASYVMMGDYVEFSFQEAKKFGFTKVHLVAQWAKLLKIAMATPQTHVRHGAIDLMRTISFLRALGCATLSDGDFNTAREIFDIVESSHDPSCHSLFPRVCTAAKFYAQSLVGDIPVAVHLISFSGEVIAQDG
jgi:cobalt-precorrin-5B (C1)-methyltransferase